MKKLISLIVCFCLIIACSISVMGCQVAECTDANHNWVLSSVVHNSTTGSLSISDCGGVANYTCDICGKTKQQAYVGHNISKTKDTDGHYSCIGCGTKINGYVNYVSVAGKGFSVIADVDDTHLFHIDETKIDSSTTIYLATIFDGKPVTKVYDLSFSEFHTDYTKSIALPGLLEEIGKSCFDYGKRISSITIPTSVKKLGSSVFQRTGYSSNTRIIYKGTRAQWRALIANSSSSWANGINEYRQTTKYIECSDGKISIQPLGYNGVMLDESHDVIY